MHRVVVCRGSIRGEYPVEMRAQHRITFVKKKFAAAIIPARRRHDEAGLARVFRSKTSRMRAVVEFLENKGFPTSNRHVRGAGWVAWQAVVVIRKWLQSKRMASTTFEVVDPHSQGMRFAPFARAFGWST